MVAISPNWMKDDFIGEWRSDDNGCYYISQFYYDNLVHVFWLGFYDKIWCHVAHGIRIGKNINLSWGDVLVGGNMLSGTL